MTSSTTPKRTIIEGRCAACGSSGPSGDPCPCGLATVGTPHAGAYHWANIPGAYVAEVSR